MKEDKFKTLEYLPIVIFSTMLFLKGDTSPWSDSDNCGFKSLTSVAI